MKWELQPQETNGAYHFSGRFLVTSGVQAELTDEEIRTIYFLVQKLVKENDGLDYLLVFKNKEELKLFFIDQLNQEMLASGDHPPEHHYCTLLLASEY